MNSLILYGFTVGAVATVNPCGFALLPAWYARGMAAHAGRPLSERLIRSVLAGGAVSLGFVVIFVVAGLLLAAGVQWLGPALPWIGITLGLGLALVGALWVLGARLPGLPVVETCRRVNTRYGAFGFGLSYGLASISCTLPVFMSVAGLSFLTSNEVSPVGLIAFLAGATSVLILVSMLGAVTGAGFARVVQVRAVLLRRLAGGLTFLAGLYLTLYWGRVFFDSTPGLDQIASAVGAYASGAAMLISSPLGIGVLLLGAFLAAGLAGVLILHGQRRSSVRPSSD
tara:strand:- start:4372 stop:5223 length:852 start_codon:yes stop_codon:yes gene_type:complete